MSYQRFLPSYMLLYHWWVFRTWWTNCEKWFGEVFRLTKAFIKVGLACFAIIYSIILGLVREVPDIELITGQLLGPKLCNSSRSIWRWNDLLNLWNILHNSHLSCKACNTWWSIESSCKATANQWSSCTPPPSVRLFGFLHFAFLQTSYIPSSCDYTNDEDWKNDQCQHQIAFKFRKRTAPIFQYFTVLKVLFSVWLIIWSSWIEV